MIRRRRKHGGNEGFFSKSIREDLRTFALIRVPKRIQRKWRRYPRMIANLDEVKDDLSTQMPTDERGFSQMI
jgi:hypothetical protein